MREAEAAGEAAAGAVRLMARGALVSIAGWSCGGHDTGPGAEEASPGNDIVFTLRGSFRRLMRGESTVADPATVLFFPRHEPYRISHPVQGGDRCAVLSLGDEALHEIAGRAGACGPFPALAAPLGPAAALRLRRLVAAAESGDPHLEADEEALSLAGQALRAADARRGTPAREGLPRRPGTSATHRLIVERVRLLAAARFREPLRLAAIAREAGASPYHLCRLFRGLTGLPVHRYINRLRLRAALDMLDAETDLTALALEVGFSSHSHFSTAFRREFGVPPSSALRSPAARATAQLRKILKAAPARRA